MGIRKNITMILILTLLGALLADTANTTTNTSANVSSNSSSGNSSVNANVSISANVNTTASTTNPPPASSNNSSNAPTTFSGNATAQALAQFNFTPASNDGTPNPDCIPPAQGNTSTSAFANITDASFKVYANLLALLPPFEQRIIAICYNSNNDTTRFISPDCYKTAFYAGINSQSAQCLAAQLTKNSKKSRNGLSCLGAFTGKFKSSNDDSVVASINTTVAEIVTAQTKYNQAQALFVKTMQEILNSRRRFILTTKANINASVTYDSNGMANGFIFNTTEQATVVTAFKTYTTALSNYLTTFSQDVVAAQGYIGQLSACQTSTNGTVNTAANVTVVTNLNTSHADQVNVTANSNATVNSNSTSASNQSQPQGNQSQPQSNQNQPQGSQTTQSQGQNNQTAQGVNNNTNQSNSQVNKTNSTMPQANTTGNGTIQGNVTIQGNTTVNIPNATNMTNQGNNSNNGQNQQNKSNNNGNQGQMVKLQATAAVASANTALSALANKTDSRWVALKTKAAADLSSTSGKPIPSLHMKVIQSLTNSDWIKNEFDKTIKNTVCPGDYLFVCTNGSCSCTDTSCPSEIQGSKSVVSATVNVGVNSTILGNSSTNVSVSTQSQVDVIQNYYIANLCLNGVRYIFSEVVVNTINGVQIDFMIGGNAKGGIGAAAAQLTQNCGASLAGNNSTAKSNCRGDMSSTCGTSLDTSCKSTGLYDTMNNNPPPLNPNPDECNDSLATYNTTTCFSWIISHLTKGTMVFDYAGFNSIAASISTTASAKLLRFLATSNSNSGATVSNNDPTQSDSKSQVNGSVNNSDMAVDGSTSTTTANSASYSNDLSTNTAANTTATSSSSSGSSSSSSWIRRIGSMLFFVLIALQF